MNELYCRLWTLCYDVACAVQRGELCDEFFRRAKSHAIMLELEYGERVRGGLQSADDWKIVKKEVI
jgi:hypothetical protein